MKMLQRVGNLSGARVQFELGNWAESENSGILIFTLLLLYFRFHGHLQVLKELCLEILYV